MSRTHSLGCHDCEVEIWIGQGSGDNQRIYQDSETLGFLERFLINHQRHRLEFYDDEGSDYEKLNLSDDD
jgi:hypothetical protein